MRTLTVRQLGATRLPVSNLGIGGSPLGGVEALYGHDTSHVDGVATARRVLQGPINLLDTSNNYGGGKSEQRIGEAIAELGGLPSGFVLSTKADADPVSGRFDRDRVLRSFEESMTRLGVEHVDVLHLHDPEGHITVEEALARKGAVAGLLELRESGRVRAVGIAGGAATEMARYVQTDLFDVLLTHNRYTLVDRTADALIDLAAARSMGVINAAPFGGGVLARSPRPDDRYAYGLGTSGQIRAAIALKKALDPLGIPIAAAALQFSTRDERIHSTLIGASAAARVDQGLSLLEIDIPQDVWAHVERCLPSRSDWIGD